MEEQSGQAEQLTVDDHWLFDHHLEEILGALNDLVVVRQNGPDAVDQPRE